MPLSARSLTAIISAAPIPGAFRACADSADPSLSLLFSWPTELCIENNRMLWKPADGHGVARFESPRFAILLKDRELGQRCRDVIGDRGAHINRLDDLSRQGV